MAFYDKFPYTNFQEINLDIIMEKILEQEAELRDFVSINALKYADPIQWNITSQYEKNTIVIDPATGVAYISVAAVPEGVAITNTSYWTKVFDLSELFADLESELSDFETNINGQFNTFKNDINDDFSDLQTNVDSEINDINDEIDAINARIGALDEKYFIFIGDSFGEGYTPDGYTTPYGTLFKNLFNIANDHWFESNVGGTGFVTGVTYLTQLQSMYNNIPDRTKITDIYVLGGRNEYGESANAILSAKQAFINYAKVNYPNATVNIGFIGRSFEYTSGTAMDVQYPVYAAYKRNTELMGGVYIDGIEAFLNDSNYFSSDRKHPNQDGQNSILNALVSYYRTGTAQYASVIYPTLTPSGVNTGTAPFGTMSMSESGEEITMVMFQASIDCNITGATINNYDAEIGTFSRLLCPGVDYSTFMGAVTVIVRYIENNATKYKVLPASCCIRHNKFYVRLTMTTSAEDNYFSGTINQIQMKGTHLTYSGYRGE